MIITTKRSSFIRLQMLKANLKLSTKRLYGADAYAIREVLKLVQLLQGTLKEEPAGNGDQKNEGDEDENVYDSYAVSSKVIISNKACKRIAIIRKNSRFE